MASTRQAKLVIEPDPDSRQPGGRQPRILLMISVVIILGVVSGQIAVTYMLAPESAHSPKEQKREVRDRVAKSQRHSNHDTPEGDCAEVSVGEFSCSNTTALRNVITHVDFKLAAVAASNQVSTLESQIKWNQNRIHEAVNRIVRSSNLEELNDPNLETIKRLVREAINELFDASLIIDVMMSDIRIIQQ